MYSISRVDRSHITFPKCVVWSVRNERLGDAFMANQWDLSNLNLDDDEDENGPNSNAQQDIKNLPKGFRSQLKVMADQNKAMAAKLAEYDAQARRGAIEKIVTEQKLNPKVAKLIPDGIESTPEAIGKWLDEYKELFSPPASEGNAQQNDEEDEDASNTVDALQRIARAQNASVPPTKVADLMSQINDPTMTQDKLLRLIESHGGGYGQ